MTPKDRDYYTKGQKKTANGLKICGGHYGGGDDVVPCGVGVDAVGADERAPALTVGREGVGDVDDGCGGLLGDLEDYLIIIIVPTRDGFHLAAHPAEDTRPLLARHTATEKVEVGVRIDGWQGEKNGFGAELAHAADEAHEGGAELLKGGFGRVVARGVLGYALPIEDRKSVV